MRGSPDRRAARLAFGEDARRGTGQLGLHDSCVEAPAGRGSARPVSGRCRARGCWAAGR